MLLFLSWSFVFCAAFDKSMVINLKRIDKINQESSTWRAGVNTMFLGKTWNDVKMMIQSSGNMENIDKSALKKDIIPNDLPDNYDFYETWSNCSRPISDQGNCGSGYAFSATNAVADRFCKAGKNVILSAQDLISCDVGQQWQSACQGGMNLTWDYFKISGVVTEKCFPYNSEGGYTTKCPWKCNDEKTDWKDDKHFVKDVTNYKSVSDAMKSIFYEGPIRAKFRVYEDFFLYQDGVYSHVHGDFKGEQTVKIQGWGVDKNGVEYWLAANSWGHYWGSLGGYFWIKRGSNESGIETEMSCATPVLH